jgi:hypothetical protein
MEEKMKNPTNQMNEIGSDRGEISTKASESLGNGQRKWSKTQGSLSPRVEKAVCTLETFLCVYSTQKRDKAAPQHCTAHMARGIFFFLNYDTTPKGNPEESTK